jgi:hypothetical protein
VPDVAADADPNTGYAIFSNGAWGITGGTSAAAPLWAAFTALVNASPTCRGATVGFVNPVLYQLAGSSYLNNFTDVTTASPFSGQANNDAFYEFNIPDNPHDLFPLATGYDMATGLGSMIAPHLAASLCSAASPVFTVGVASPGTQTTTVGHGVSVQIHGSDSGNAALLFGASGLPAGLSINAGNGVISGTPTTAQTTTVTVSAADGFKNAGSVSFVWHVVKPAPPRAKTKVSKLGLTGLANGRPKLSFSIGAAKGARSLKAVSISLPRGLSFTRKSKRLSKGLTVKNGRKLKFKTKLNHGVLTISLKKPQGKVSITAARPALGVSRSLASKVRKHKVKKLTVVLKSTDTANKTTRLPERLRVK